MDYVLPFRPCAVSATGLSHVPGGTENIAYLTLFFEGSQIAHIHCQLAGSGEAAATLIGASRKMIVYDDLDQAEKIKVYDKGITLNSQQNPEKMYQTMVGYRTGDMLAPQIDRPKRCAGRRTTSWHVSNRGRTDTGGNAGLRVVAILRPPRSRWRNTAGRWNCARLAARSHGLVRKMRG